MNIHAGFIAENMERAADVLKDKKPTVCRGGRFGGLGGVVEGGCGLVEGLVGLFCVHAALVPCLPDFPLLLFHAFLTGLRPFLFPRRPSAQPRIFFFKYLSTSITYAYAKGGALLAVDSGSGGGSLKGWSGFFCVDAALIPCFPCFPRLRFAFLKASLVSSSQVSLYQHFDFPPLRRRCLPRLGILMGPFP